MLDLASYYSSRDTIYAVHYFDKLQHHLDVNPQLTGFMPRLYVELGVMYYYADVYEKAEMWFQKAAGTPEINLDSPTLSRLWFFTGVMDELRGESDSALLYFRKSLSIAVKSNNIDQKAAALHELLLLIGMLIISCFGFAQYTITYSNHAPQVGDIITLSNVTEYTDLDPGNAGGNQTWDFSAYPASGLSEYYYEAPENTLWAGQVGDCNMALVGESKDQTVLYYKISPNDQRLKFVGTDYSGFQTLSEYWNDYLEMVFPFGFNDSFTDDIAYTIDYSQIGYNMLDSAWSELTVLADGWGTLITPEQEYTDVLRVKYTINESWKTYAEGILVDSGSWTETAYHWYCAGSKHSVARVSVLDDGQDPITTIQYGSSAVGIGDHNHASFAISPNPASESFRIKGIPDNTKTIALFDYSGRQVADYRVNASSGVFSCADVPAGLYFVTLFDENKEPVSVGKIVISH